MARTTIVKAALIGVLLTVTVGLVDSTLEGSRDHAVLFGVAVGLSPVVVPRFWVGRPPASIRRDLLRWATERSQLTGEPVEHILDRSIAGYRALLDEPPAAADPGPAERKP